MKRSKLATIGIGLFLSISICAKEFSYRWYLTSSDKVKLILYMPQSFCKQLRNKAIFIFLSKKGRIYRKTFKRNYGCKIIKRFKNPQPFRVLIFYPKVLKVKDLGVINWHVEKIY